MKKVKMSVINRKITRYILLGLIFIFSFSLKAEDFIVKAMKDEINRSLNDLKVGSLQKPYYIEYKLVEKTSYSIQATLGTITQSERVKTNHLSTGVRVGSYKFDNTNFFDFGFSFFGSGDEEESFKNRLIPFELDYPALRRELWLATDAAYKQVSEVFTKKVATVENRVRKDTTHDFLFIKPEKYFDTTKIPDFDRNYFEDLARKVSSVFRDYPEIQSSTVSVEFLPETIYYVNSEGREYIKTEYYVGLELASSTQATDGMPLADVYSVYSRTPQGLPSGDSLIAAAKQSAYRLSQLSKAKTLEEPYTGPILFEGQAAAELFAQVFAPNLVTQREPMTEQGSQEGDRFTAFQSKIGGRVLPEFLSIVAEPSKTLFGKTPLLGNYKIDDEGVLSEDVSLVKDGYLKNLLSCRVPTRRVRKSNGHQRGGASMLSIVEMTSDKEHSKDYKDLKKKLITLCKDRELPYGIIVRRLMNQNMLYTTLFRLTMGDYPIPQGNAKIPAIEAYKIYPDGKEELVRGCETKGMTVQSFKDLLLTGKTLYALNYLAPSVTSPYVSGGSQYVGATVITPDMLFEDAEIHTTEDDFPKPPIIQNPLSKK